VSIKIHHKKSRKQKILNSLLINTKDRNAKKISLIHKTKYLNYQIFSEMRKNKLVLKMCFLLT
jgi:hypothetical protein